MGTEGGGAVGKRAAQGKIHSAGDIIGVPVACPIMIGGVQGAAECAVGIGATRPYVALVEMGVHVDEAQPHHAAIEIDSGQDIR